MSNNQIFIASGRAITTVSDSDNSIFGSNATTDEVVKITDAAATNIIVDANVERVQFTGAIADYKYLVVGTNLKIYNAAGTLVSTIGVQADETTVQLAAGAKLGTQLTFANGTVDAKITGLNAVTLGDQAVSATTAAAVVIPTAKIDATLASAPIPVFSVAGAASATEGGNALFTVTLANPSATTATTVKYALSNLGTTTSADYGTAVTAGTNVTDAAGTLTFAAGATTATVTVPVTFDSAIETGEGVTLTLSAPSAGTVSSTGAAVTTAFADAPAPTFVMTSSATAGIATQEGKTITFTVTPSGIVNAATVLNLNVVGAALGAISATTSATDFTTASAITFAAGETAAKTITVTVVNDGTTEGIEAYKAQLLDSSYNEKAAIQGTVTDATPTVTLTAAAASVDEGKALVFTATSDIVAPAGGLVVPVTFGGTATTADYTTTATSITIAAGQLTGTLSLNAIADNATEGAETVTATLGNVNGATTVTTPVTVTINDTSLALAANAFSLSGAATANEGTSVAYTITRGAAATVLTTVPYTITGTATSGSDYTAQTGTASFAIGATTATITLPITADTLTEGSETVIVTLGTPSVATDIVTAGAGTVTTTIADTSLTVVGTTFTLTTGLDTVTGNTTVNGILSDGTGEQTWSLTDSIVGTSSTTDVVNARIIGDSSAGVVRNGLQTSAVEIVNFSYLDANDAADSNSVSATGFTGLTKLAVSNSSNINTTSTNRDTLAFTSVPAGVALEVSNNTAQTSVTYTGVGTATSGDSVTLNAAGGSTGVVTFTDSAATPDGYVTVNVVTSGTASTIKSLAAGTSNTTVNVTGSQALTITDALSSTVKTFDASAASGAVTVGVVGSATLVAKGSSATTDKLSVVVDSTIASGAAITGFETVVFDTTGTGSFALNQITGSTATNVANGSTTGTLTLTNAAAGQGLNFVGDKTTVANLSFDNVVQTLTTDASTTSDSLAITINNDGTATTKTATAGTVVVGNYEVVTLTSGNFATSTLGALTLSTTATTLTINAATNLVVGGLPAVTTTLATVNAGGSTGNVTLGTIANTGNMTYTGSAGVDSLTNGVVATTALQTFNLGAGNDSIHVVATAAGAAQVVVNGDAGDDLITLDAAIATASLFTINGGAGTDTLVSTHASFIDAFAGVEQVTLLGSGLITNYGVASGYAETVSLTQVGTSSNVVTLNSTGSASLANWTTVGTAAALTLNGTTGADTLTGSTTMATLISGSTGNDTIVLGTLGTVTGGTGADTITLSTTTNANTVNIATGDTVCSIGGSGNAGTISGYDVVTNFEIAVADVLTFTSAAGIVSVGATTDGATNSTLTIGGAVVGKHTLVATGAYTFQTGTDGSTGTASITDNASLAAVVQYLSLQDLGNAGSVATFTGTIGGVAQTWVYQQVTTNAGATDQYELVQLVGVTAAGTETANSGATLLFIA